MGAGTPARHNRFSTRIVSRDNAISSEEPMNWNAREMNEAFMYQISDLDQVVTSAGYARCRTGDVSDLADHLQTMILCEDPTLENQGLVIVICDTAGAPLYFRPLGTVH